MVTDEYFQGRREVARSIKIALLFVLVAVHAGAAGAVVGCGCNSSVETFALLLVLLPPVLLVAAAVNLVLYWWALLPLHREIRLWQWLERLSIQSPLWFTRWLYRVYMGRAYGSLYDRGYRVRFYDCQRVPDREERRRMWADHDRQRGAGPGQVVNNRNLM